MSLLVISEMLGVSLNRVTADDEYSLRNSENLPQPIQMHLSKKKNLFYEFFARLLKFKSNFEHFEKKDGLHCP